MAWFLWQQQRRLVIGTAAALAVTCALLVASGLDLSATYHTALRTCKTSLGGCGNLSGTAFQGDNRLFDMVDALGFSVPFLLALFWGAPLVARETEEGTHRLVWSQGITRLRWLAGKLGGALLAAVVLVGTLSIVVMWWYRPVEALQHDRLGSVVFDTQGLVPVGYALFGVALGTLAGALSRRTLPAMAATLGIFGLVRYGVDQYVRPFLLPPKHIVASITAAFGSNPAAPGSWVLWAPKIVGPSGRALSGSKLVPAQIPGACRQFWFSDNKLASCLDGHGFHALVTYQPASRYWPIQGTETAIYIAGAAVCVALACWWVVRRDA